MSTPPVKYTDNDLCNCCGIRKFGRPKMATGFHTEENQSRIYQSVHQLFVIACNELCANMLTFVVP